MPVYNRPKDIIDEIILLRKRLEKVEKTSQLPYSSIEADQHLKLNEASVHVHDGNGQLRQIVGKQVNGTYGITILGGPIPNTPSVPTVVAVTGAFAVAWDGLFPAGRPDDLDHVDVHISIISGFQHSAGSRATSFDKYGGDSATIQGVPGVPYYVVLVAVSTSQTESLQTTEVTVTPLGGGAGSGDVTGPGAAVVGELAVYADTTGETLGRSTGDGLLKLVDGVYEIAVAGVDYALPGGGGGGGTSWAITAVKTSAYTASDHEFVLCDASGGSFTVTLPAASAGAEVEIKKVDSGQHSIHVQATGLVNIDNITTDVIVDLPWQSQRYISGPTQWYRA